MPRYHFHVSEDGEPDLDTQGTEFPSTASAGADALRYAGGVIRDRAGRSDPEGAWRVDGVDETLFRVGVTVEAFPAAP